MSSSNSDQTPSSSPDSGQTSVSAASVSTQMSTNVSIKPSPTTFPAILDLCFSPAHPNLKLIYFFIVFIFLLPLPFSTRIFNAAADVKSHTKTWKYDYGQRIPLYSNRVFEADKQRPAYSYFSLPFCPPGEKITNRKRILNEILAGDCLTNTHYELKFGVSDLEGLLCKKYMTKDDLKRFKNAIENKFEYQMYFANIWFGSKVGEVIEEAGLEKKVYLFDHIEFNVDFMDHQVIAITIVNSLYTSLDISHINETLVEFSYSVLWNEIKPTNNSSYLLSENKTSAEKASWVLEEDRASFWSEIWLWTVLSFWWIALPFVFAYPYLFRYFLKNRQPHQGLRHFNDRLCHCPMFTSLFGATLGVGTQHLVIIVLLLIFAYEGVYPCDSLRVSMYLVLAYCVTSVAAAFLGRSIHEKFSPIGSKECVIQTWALYTIPGFIAIVLAKIFVGSSLMANSALFYVSITTFMSAILVYSCCIKTGDLYKQEQNLATCITKMIVIDEPTFTGWYTKTLAQMVFVGLTIFLSVSLIMEDAYLSLWGLKVCGTFHSLRRLCVILISTAIGSGFVLTPIQQFNNDYHWHWRSILHGGSPAIYVFVYGIYFLSKIKTEESDIEFLPVLVYHGYVCYSFFLVLGTLDYAGSLLGSRTFAYLGNVIVKKRS